MAHFYDETISSPGTKTPIDWPGGPGVFGTQGTFSNLTVTLEFSINGGSTWTTMPGPNFVHTDDNVGAFQVFPCQLRLNVTGSGGIATIKARIAPALQGYALDSVVF